MKLGDLIGKSTLPTRRWMDLRFPQIDEFATKARRHLHGVEPWCAVQGRVPPVIGTAMDYRIRYAFGITPVDEFVAFGGAAMVLTDVLGLEPVIDLDKWIAESELLAKGGSSPGVGPARTKGSLLPWLTDPDTEGLPPNFVSEFFARLRARVPELAPVNRPLMPAEEANLTATAYCSPCSSKSPAAAGFGRARCWPSAPERQPAGPSLRPSPNHGWTTWRA